MYSFIKILYVLLLLWGMPSSATFPPAWCAKIQAICRMAEHNPVSYPPVPLPTIQLDCATAPNDPMNHLIPPILLWTPTEQFPSLFPNGILCPVCEENRSQLQMYGWKDGSGGSRNEPRKIHGICSVILLVSRVYKCKKGHEISACNPKILVCHPVPELIPFQLWHITGFTTNFINYVASLVSAGVSLGTITDVVSESRIRMYLQSKQTYVQLLLHNPQQAPGPVFPTYDYYREHLSKSTCPSKHTISQLFLWTFWKKERTYNAFMRKTGVMDDEPWLSCDHTFASAGKDVVHINYMIISCN